MTLTGLRVLLAEDNPTNQMVATQMLESLGATVTLARDGAEALEIIAREAFDVMLVDIEMPRVSGIDVIRRIRDSAPPLSGMPLIALTAYVMREHRAAIDAAGADGVIAKPILSIEQFGADIRHLMQARGATPAQSPAQSPATAPATVPDQSPDMSGATSRALSSAPSPAPSPTDAGAPAGASPAIDRTVYDALAEAIGDGAMSELLEKVDADVRSARDRLAQGLESGDIDAIRSASHILISVAGAVGAVHVQEAARRINAAANLGDTAAVEEAAPILLGEIERMLAFVAEQAKG